VKKTVKVVGRIPTEVAFIIEKMAKEHDKDVRNFTGMLIYKGLETLLQSSQKKTD